MDDLENSVNWKFMVACYISLFSLLATPTLILGVQKAKAESGTYLQGKFT